jgi:hypothetical protein
MRYGMRDYKNLRFLLAEYFYRLRGRAEDFYNPAPARTRHIL